MALSLEKKRKDCMVAAKERTYLLVHRDVYDLIKYYAIKKDITMVQAACEIIVAGFRRKGWFRRMGSQFTQ